MTAHQKKPATSCAVRRHREVQAAPRSKKQEFITLLSHKRGADINQLSDTLGWLPHSVRAALVGLARTGIEVERLPKTRPGPLRYRIAQGAKASK